MSDAGLVTYDPATSQLNTVPTAFAERPQNVLSIIWRPGIDPGHEVHAGDEVGDIQWADNSREPIVAPDECSGSIASVNRNIPYAELPFTPSQWLLILS